MLTVQVKTRVGSKTEGWGIFPGYMFADFVFFRNEEKNKVEKAKGGKSVPKEAEAGQDRVCAAQGSLINLCLMLNAAPWSCVQRG